MPNMYGDIINDLCAILVGGLGLTPRFQGTPTEGESAAPLVGHGTETEHGIVHSEGQKKRTNLSKPVNKEGIAKEKNNTEDEESWIKRYDDVLFVVCGLFSPQTSFNYTRKKKLWNIV